MRTRTATSIQKEAITIEAFKEKAFFEPIETSCAFYDDYGTPHIIPDKKVLLKKDGSYISTVGKNYSIVDNEKYFMGVINSLNEGGVEWQPKNVYQEGNGKRTTMIVKLPQFTLFPNSTEHQDMELRIRNSFDATLAADTTIGFLRLICTNGMTAFDKSFEHRMIHKGDILQKSKDAIELYKDFENVWQRTKDKIEYLGNMNGTKDDVRRYIGDGTVSLNGLFKGERWAAKLLEKWQQNNETVNFWELYNMFTHTLSHEYGANYSAKQNKMEELNKELKRWEVLLRPTTIIMEDAIYG